VSTKKLPVPPRSARRWYAQADGFRLLRKTAGLTIEQCAAELGVTGRTVSKWESGRVRVPYAPYKLLRLLRGTELPYKGWEGYLVVGDRLISPEGHSFSRADLAWLSLTFRRAEAFAQVFEKLKFQRTRVIDGRFGPVVGTGVAANGAWIGGRVGADRREGPPEGGFPKQRGRRNVGGRGR